MSSQTTNTAIRGSTAGRPTLRARGGLARALLLVLLPLILGPLVTFAVVIFRETQSTINNQVLAQLTGLAVLKEDQIDEWARSRVANLSVLARSPDMIRAVRGYLDGSQDASAISANLDAFLNSTGFFEAAMLARPEDGVVLVSTVAFRYDRFVGESFLSPAQVSMAQAAPFMLPPVYDVRVSDVQVLVVAPLFDEQRRLLALLYGFVRDEQLLDIVAPSPGLGRTGRAYVITSDGYQLGSFVTQEGSALDSEGIHRARMDKQSGSGIYEDPSGQQVYGVYRWLPAYQLALLIEQSTEEAYAPLRHFATVLGGIGLAAIVVSSGGVWLFTRRLITRPLHSLTESAQRMAGGDLTAMVSVNRQDEIGLLASAFNDMAGELRALYQDLENKVEARTQQLAAAAEVGRAATSILSTDDLLAHTVELIRDRFGYYHVSIFLLDEAGRWAVLRESTGEIGQQLKARGHRLEVGSNSLIGWVTANRRPRIAFDVAGDAVHFRNELLPETRSEAALPLRVGERVIGALDVQSRTLNAFNQSDIEVLQILADQIAVAVENGRLFARQEQITQLAERTSALAASIHRAPSLEAILDSAASQLSALFGAEKVVVRLEPEVALAASAERGQPHNGHHTGEAPNGGSPKA